ncbi:EF-hand domain-containing protein [Synechococcus sp. Cruz-9H2]|uniref:EF-hand domain-containing protein n=1 Tax=unclassified Synechococcus TaxID=2626047 RepID=UPI0020CEFC51|nr:MULTISPECIES: EF-hand domain-containing protein [unclassified Synechococcus]MCP9818788.1 EF-hand domain-containing protein [Synechococcus sp. Cruz-9H2]MCP9843018.1 EF-hand domain-containing protein [Synechococcus sp. Edmonson 11F2]MCP9857233.1 EF-hand domain-containing protein [Synechococcus sp. Cruz-9C9]MCP9862070.1 EF-hand domain-containing protein [Synechococcus sp. Cruz-7E5]MCP9869341.1 EF-hand domain-containing protein [Synechococcus sp. Cruz-7B9]
MASPTSSRTRPDLAECSSSNPLRLVLLLASLLLSQAGPGIAQDARSLQLYHQRMQAWFERLDRNGDGRLSPQEIRGQPYLETNFERLDQRGRGYLLPTDLAPRQPALLGVRLHAVFTQADRNGDGQLSRQEARSFPWLNRRFSKIDLDSNGFISLQELWESRRSLAPRP